MKLAKRLSCLLLALLFAMALPVQVLAEEYDLNVGSVTVTTNEGGGQSVTQVNGVTNEVQTTTTVITQSNPETPTSHTVTITGGGEANVTIKDVNISSSSDAAVKAEGTTSANVTLEGINTVTSASGSAGVQVNAGASVTITEGKGGGSLTATGGDGGAGIGGGNGAAGGEITITSGTIHATGGSNAAGIGGGANGGAGKIEINGGNVSAMGSGTLQFGFDENGKFTNTPTAGGAGIGSGSDAQGTVGSITISGSDTVVDATGGGAGAGIGNGMNSNGTDVVITGGDVAATAYYGPDGLSADSAHISGNGTVTDNGVLIYPNPSQSAPQPSSQNPSTPKNTYFVDFWASVNWKISQAEEGSTLTVDAGSFTWIPRYVIENAISCNVTLIIQWNGGKDITIKPTDESGLTSRTIQLKDLL